MTQKPKALEDIDVLKEAINEINANKRHSINYSVADILSTGICLGGFIAPMALNIESIKLKVKAAPTGSDLIVDLNKNGTSIYSTQANRPKIIAGDTSATATLPDDITIADGDWITLDIVQIGSSSSGEALTLSVVCKEV